ncbi:MAG: sensor histidine kinase [Solirubrobacteraceae bacterium]
MYNDPERSWLVRRIDAAAPWVLDVAIVLVLIVPTVAIFAHGAKRPTGLNPVTIVFSALSVMPLLVRRRWPVEALSAILILGVAAPGPAVFSPPALVALYTIASRRPRRVAIIAAGLVIVVFVLRQWVWGYNLPLSGVISAIALTGAALALGLYRATRLAYVEQLRERAARLERERELLGEQAAADERLRIARELHDVVAHNVSLMVIQAQALAATAAEDEAAKRSAETIADLGRGAMSEMHRTLELMRDGSSDGGRAPQPTLAELGPLLEQARAAGVSADLLVTGRARALEAGVELSAYRIVQEALTNVIKHAGSAHASVRVAYGDSGLELEILDDGPGAPNGEHARAGHGLVGMRERVALFGGSLETGPANGAGYRVRARLPYAETR